MLFTIQKPEAQSELLQSASLQQQRNIQKGQAAQITWDGIGTT